MGWKAADIFHNSECKGIQGNLGKGGQKLPPCQCIELITMLLIESKVLFNNIGKSKLLFLSKGSPLGFQSVILHQQYWP